MSEAEDKFRALAREVAPLDAEAGKLKLEMVALSREISTEIVADAYPEARHYHVRTFSEIRPSDNGAQARTAVETLKAHGITPTIIIVDHNRHIVLLCTEHTQLLPSTAKPQIKKKPKRELDKKRKTSA